MTHVGTAQEIKLPVLIPIGGGELDVYSELTYELVDLTKDGDIHIFLLPVGFSKSEQYILSDLQEIIQTACQNALIAENGTRKCMVSLAPDVNSTNVDDLEISQEITNELSAIIILSPSSDLTMNILHGTKVERSLEDAYHHGVIIVGSSEAGNLLSRTMLVDYADGFSAENALQFGAVEVWGDDLRRGLEFGNPLSIIDTHIFQDGHLTRLINAIALPDVPHIGIGVDAFSGVMVQNQEELKNAFGSYDVVIIDAETYQAANGVEYRGTNNLISLRNVLVHKISSEESTYNLRTRELSLAPPNDELSRKDVIPPISDQAGVLILNGGFNSQYTAIRPLERFEN